jgi:hypothetical protein
MGKPTSPLPNMETPPEAALRHFIVAGAGFEPATFGL